MKKRYPEFDVAKAIALAGVIIGHSIYLGTPDRLASVFYSFDMPLFLLSADSLARPRLNSHPTTLKRTPNRF